MSARKMAEAINSMLVAAKKMLTKSLELKEVWVVLGNETCDLDSAVSSLAYSLLLATINRTAVPVFNIPRLHLPLKTEVTYLLNKHNIDLNNIVCRDEIDLTALHNAGSLRLVLVDHHALLSDELVGSVVIVMDHRPPDPQWLWPQADVTLHTVGSCCTLVAQELLSTDPLLVSPVVAEMLLGAILLDTACLSEEADRAAPQDHSMAQQLQSVWGGSPNELFRELQAAKSDVSSLTTAQLLIKDLKVAAGIPIAGLPIRVETFLTYPDVRDAVRQFCTKHNYSACVVYGSEVKDSSVTRDLAVFSADGTPLSNLIVDALTSSTEPNFNLQPRPCSIEGCQLFEQLNVKLTRKQMLPIVRLVGQSTLNDTCLFLEVVNEMKRNTRH